MNRISSYSPMAGRIFLRTSSLVSWLLYNMFNNLRYISPQRFAFFFSSSAVKVHDLQAYKNMAMKSRCIILTFDPGGMLLSLQIGFSFVRDAEACAVLEETSNFSHLLRHCILPCIKRLYIVPIFYQLLNSYTSYIYHVMEYAM